MPNVTHKRGGHGMVGRGYGVGMTVPLPDEAVRLAQGANLATVVTLMPDGQPQALPVWVDTDGEHLLINTEPQRQRSKNIERDPRITVLIQGPTPWEWAEVRGRVTEVVGEPRAREHIDELSQKYTGAPYANPIGPEGRSILVVTPEKVNLPG